MKQCPKCSAKSDNVAGFCKECGESLAEVEIIPDEFSAMAGDFISKAGGLLSAEAKKAKEAASVGAQKAQKAASEGMAKAQEKHQDTVAQKAEWAKKSNMFVDPSETAIATIGSNYMQSILSGGRVTRGYAMLTGKRVYYGGKSFSGLGKSAKSSTEECIIPVEDISLTRFIHGRATGALIFGLLFLALGAFFFLNAYPRYFELGRSAPGQIKILVGAFAIAGIALLVKSFISRSTLFEIAFPGGKFLFDIKWYPIADMQDFQHQLHLVKDSCKNG